MAQPLHDLAILKGTLVDPAQGISARRDVAFRGGRVSAVEAAIPPASARETIDASGRIVAPGLIDLHVHVFWGGSHFGIDPDSNCVAKGVTTAVDAGSAGADNFPGFRKYIIDVSATRIFACLNISAQGMLDPDIGELEDLRYARVDRALETIEKHRDAILGVKVRLSRGSICSEATGIRPLHLAREAADAAGLPIMVHPQGAWRPSIDDVLAVMRDRDILTHCFHAEPICGIMDDAGKVRRSVREAMERGVVLDVGHGAGSFSWEVAERALAQGVEPRTISSDLHHYNVNGPVFDLATTVSKFLELGFSLEKALEKTTAEPARAIGMEGEIGTLRVGAWGDAAVFEVKEGKFEFRDSKGVVRTGGRKLEPATVVKGGRVYRGRVGD